MDLLGLNLPSFIAQIINFSILFFILKKFIFNTVVELVKENKKRKKEALKKTEAIEKEYQKLDQSVKNKLASAEKKADSIILDAKKTAEAKKKEIISLAKEEAKKVQEEALKAIENEKKQMKIDLENYASTLAVKIASNLIAKFLDQDKQKTIIQKSILKLKKI